VKSHRLPDSGNIRPRCALLRKGAHSDMTICMDFDSIPTAAISANVGSLGRQNAQYAA
jgi:hypothetical protein